MKKWDKIIMFTILFLAVIGALYFYLAGAQEHTDKMLVVRHHGEKIFEIILTEDTNETFVFENNGERNTITIEKGIVFIEEATCRDQICVNHRRIHRNRETIVCLPHGLVLEIFAYDEPILFDSIVE